jgi:hypothetical protein
MSLKEILKMTEYENGKGSGVYQIKLSIDGEIEYIVVHGCCLPTTFFRVMNFIGREYDGVEVEFLGMNAIEGEYIDLDEYEREYDDSDEEDESKDKGGGSINTQGGDEKPGYWSGGRNGSGYLN